MEAQGDGARTNALIRIRAAGALALIASFASTLVCDSAIAQQVPVSRDSLPRDTIARDTLRRDTVATDTIRLHPIHPGIMYLLLPASFAMVVVAVVAPAPLAAWFGQRGPTKMSFLNPHAEVRLSGGGQLHQRWIWANAAEFQVVRNNRLGELQVEDIWRPSHVRYLTLSAGQLWHPRHVTAGGITLGYVYAQGDATQSGPALGLPLYIGDSNATMRLEPAYIMSRHGLLWNGRLQAQANFPGRPYFVGASLVGKSQNMALAEKDHLFASAVTVLFGTRF